MSNLLILGYQSRLLYTPTGVASSIHALGSATLWSTQGRTSSLGNSVNDSNPVAVTMTESSMRMP